MKQNSFKDLPRLTNENYENIFNIFTDKDDRYFYNLLQTIEFPQNLPDGYFITYNIKYGDTWPFISYKVYNTPNVWWIILLANKIDNPITSLVPGTSIKIPKIEVVKIILAELITQN